MPDETFNVNVNFHADDSDVKRAEAEIEAKRQQLESRGIKIKLYTELQGAGLSESEIKSGFQSLGLPVSDYKAASDAASQIATESRSASSAVQSLSQAQQQAGASFSQSTPAINASAVTLKGLRSELNDAKNEFDGSPAAIKRLSSAQKEYNTVLGQANEAMGKTGSAYNSLGSIIERQLTRIAIGVAVWTTLRTAQQEIQETIRAMQQYSVEVARFAAVTDQSIGSAIIQYNALGDAATLRGFTPTESAPAILEAGRVTKSAAGQQQLMTSGTGLAEFLGVDPKKAVDGLNEAMLALGANENDVAKIADMIGAAYKRVGGDATQFLSAMTNAALIGDKLGVSFDKTFAMITSGAQVSGRSMDVVYSTLNRFSESLGNLSVDKTIEVARGFKELGINALDAQGKIRPVGDLITEIGSKWSTMSSDSQEQAIALLSGNEKLKGQAYAAAKGIMESYATGWSDGFKDVEGTIQEGLNKIDSSFGQAIKRRDAIIQSMEQQGQMMPALVSKVLGGIMPYTSGASGGLESEMIAKSYQVGTFQAIQMSRDDVMKRVVGMTPEDAEKAISEFNTAVNNLMKAFPISTIGVGQFLVGREELNSVMKNAGANAGKAFVGGFLGMMNIGDVIKNAIKGIAADNAPVEIPVPERPRFDLGTPQGELGYKLSQYAQNPQGGAFPLTTQETDLTKLSQDEINRAKQLSVQISNMELEAMRQQLMLLGLSKSEIDAIILAQEKELDATVKLLQTRQGVNYEMGKTVANLDKALSQMNSEKQSSQSNFQFQRLKNVDPSQFGQLEGLAQMYNKFLTNIGSPEKSQNINLLLGEQNVFKTMNVRMTALQLALEDLTKIEKAQLSGTWNLPAGATALVPISSLDIQRWNGAGGGGGLSADALAALMGVEGATNQSGDKVKTAVDNSAQSIVAAINKGFFPDQQEEMTRANSEADQKKSSLDAINNMPDFLEELARANSASNQQTVPPQPSVSRDMEYYRSLLKESDRYPGEFKSSIPSFRQMETVNVNVSALPLKATFNANLSVVLNGQIVAKAIMPILYQMMIKMSNSTPTTGGGLGALR